MGKIFEVIDERLGAWLAAQHVFFVGTAPSGEGGHINVSPKGLDGFRVVDARTVAYLDLNGSGVETIAHLRQNGRIVLMFCAFDGPPRIVRLHGRGRVLVPGTEEFAGLRGSFGEVVGVRSIIHVAVERISDSCGYAVPRFDYVGERSQLLAWADKKGPDGLAEYRATRNATSIDGLPGWGPDDEPPAS